MLVASVIQTVSSIAAAFATNYVIFIFLRFLIAFSVSGVFECGFVLGKYCFKIGIYPSINQPIDRFSIFSPNFVSINMHAHPSAVHSWTPLLDPIDFSVTEICGPKYRTYFGILTQFPFGIGAALLPLVAYFVREWKSLQLAISIPCVLLASYYW